MQSIRFIVGRPRGSSRDAIQALYFSTADWSERDAREWIHRNGFKVRNLDKELGWWRARQREENEFDLRTLRPIDTARREKVTMASNPKRRGRKRRTTNNPKRRRRVRAKAKTTRTTVKTVRVMRTNARKPKRRRRRPVKRNARPVAKASTRYTIAFTPAAARLFARIARLSKVRRREMLRALRRHPTGGVYVSSPAWHGTKDQARRLAERVRLVLAYAAGRRRSSLSGLGAPRVVAVP